MQQNKDFLRLYNDVPKCQYIRILYGYKKYQNKHQGIIELNNYDSFDAMYLKKYYSKFHIVRTVVLYGSTEEQIAEVEVGFLLNANGKLVLGIKAPKLFRRAINNLLDYWN